MSAKVIDVYRQAEQSFLAKQYESALAGFATVVRSEPEHLWSRFQIGRVLDAMKEINRAFEVFNALAWHCAKAGYPVLAFDAIKRAFRMQAGAEDSVEIVGELYSLESERIAEQTIPYPVYELNESTTVKQPVPVDDRLVRVAEQIAKSFGNTRYPKNLPPVPLFSFLSNDAFFPVLDMLDLKTYPAGELIVKEGEPCTSLFILAHGEIEVVEQIGGKPEVCARLSSGAVFGEMALITDAPRLASAVARTEVDVLELHSEELRAAEDELDDLTWAVAKFTRERFLNYLLNTSPVFTPFPPDTRKEILDRFTSIGVPTDDVVIREGMPGPGLYLILGGEVEVSKQENGRQVVLTTLREGEVFGEISLIQNTPATATVRAIRGGEFIFLARDEFNDLVSERPDIRSALSRLSTERLQDQRKKMDGAAPSTKSPIF